MSHLSIKTRQDSPRRSTPAKKHARSQKLGNQTKRHVFERKGASQTEKRGSNVGRSRVPGKESEGDSSKSCVSPGKDAVGWMAAVSRQHHPMLQGEGQSYCRQHKYFLVQLWRFKAALGIHFFLVPASIPNSLLEKKKKRQ